MFFAFASVPNTATREVFGNIAPWMRVVFFAMIAVSIGWLAWQLEKHRAAAKPLIRFDAIWIIRRVRKIHRPEAPGRAIKFRHQIGGEYARRCEPW